MKKVFLAVTLLALVTVVLQTSNTLRSSKTNAVQDFKFHNQQVRPTDYIPQNATQEFISKSQLLFMNIP